MADKVPESVKGEIEKLVAGEGPFADQQESELLRTEDISLPSMDDPQVQDDAEAVQSAILRRLEALEQVQAPLVEPQRPILLPSDTDGFWAQLTADAADGNANRRSYTFAEVYKATAGYAGWATLPGGRTGTARNIIEDGNDAESATQLGNGVTVSNLTLDEADFTFEPVPTDFRVWIRTVVVADGTIEFWFNYENGVDGGCDA